MSDPREDLATYLGPVLASDLRAHVAREAVFVVRHGADLLTCARALAADDVERVRGWLDDGTLRRPSEEERAAWLADPERRLVAVPVQPFVLVQVIEAT